MEACCGPKDGSVVKERTRDRDKEEVAINAIFIEGWLWIVTSAL